MLRITADVNGRLIGYLFVHNTSVKKGRSFVYDAATWSPAHEEGIFGIEAVMHRRSDPWLTLVAKVAEVAKGEL